jgi:hypothetical protein
MECAAVIDVVRFLRRIPGAELDRAKHLITRIISMLSRLCRPAEP